MIHKTKEEFHKCYYEDDMLVPIDQDSLSKNENKTQPKDDATYTLTSDKSWSKRKLNNDVGWTFALRFEKWIGFNTKTCFIPIEYKGRNKA